MRKPKTPAPTEVPEADRHEEVDRPDLSRGERVPAVGAVAILQADEVPGVEREQVSGTTSIAEKQAARPMFNVP